MLELPANLTVIIQIILFILGAYLFALYLGLLVWTWRDIRARSRDLLTALLSLLVVLLFNLPGLLLYFVLRPRQTLSEVYARELEEEALLQEIEDRHTCPECERRVEPDFMLCPWCLATLRNRCSVCGNLLNLRWEVCPHCGEKVPAVEEIMEGIGETVEDETETPETPEDDVVGDVIVEDEPMTGEMPEIE
ncbi:MAG: zinc ribbon domain-containing protein [Anaerolineae bacterium]|nr:zinc ribbon domain-containing protein [Anaerolineae bacterium]